MRVQLSVLPQICIWETIQIPEYTGWTQGSQVRKIIQEERLKTLFHV